jgi:hypothetical protein
MRRRRWQERSDRPARPKVRRLSAEERDNYLSAMMRGIECSPVLTALSFEVRSLYDQAERERWHQLSQDLVGEEKMARLDVTDGNGNDAL